MHRAAFTTALFALFAAAFIALPALAASGGGSLPSATMARERVNPAEAYQEGMALLQAGDFKKAERKFKSALSADRKHAGANHGMGLAKLGRGKAKDARKYLERAVEYGGHKPEPYRDLGIAYLELGREADAEAQLAALARLKAECAGCGESFVAEIDAAHAALAEAIATGGGGDQIGRLDLPTLKDGDNAYLAAVAFINQARYEAAAREFERSSYAIGPHPDILNYLGFAHRKLGRYEVAKSYYARALAIDPDHKGATEYLGELYLETGELKKAQRQLARLDEICSFGCAEREELARWIDQGVAAD